MSAASTSDVLSSCILALRAEKVGKNFSLRIDQFPTSLQSVLQEIDHEGNGVLELDEITEVFTMYADMKRAGAKIAISTCPKGLRDTLQKFDVDGDGTVGTAELARAAELYKREQARAKKLLKTLVLVMLLALISMGIMLGLMVGANEWSKDTRPAEGGELKTVSGEPVTVRATESQMVIWNLPQQPADVLKQVKDLSIEVGGVLFYFTIGKFKWYSVVKMSMFSTTGDVIEIEENRVKVVEASGPTHIKVYPVEEQRRARRLQAAYNSQDVESGGRRLNALGALMTSGSFTMMSAGGEGMSPPVCPPKPDKFGVSKNAHKYCMMYALGWAPSPVLGHTEKKYFGEQDFLCLSAQMLRDAGDPKCAQDNYAMCETHRRCADLAYNPLGDGKGAFGEGAHGCGDNDDVMVPHYVAYASNTWNDEVKKRMKDSGTWGAIDENFMRSQTLSPPGPGGRLDTCWDIHQIETGAVKLASLSEYLFYPGWMDKQKHCRRAYDVQMMPKLVPYRVQPSQGEALGADTKCMEPRGERYYCGREPGTTGDTVQTMNIFSCDEANNNAEKYTDTDLLSQLGMNR